MSSGRPPVRMPESDEGGIPGRRAAFKVPRGVEEAVMLGVTGVSEVERRDGIRGLEVVGAVTAKSLACVSAGKLIESGSAAAVLVGSCGSRMRASSFFTAPAIAATPTWVGLVLCSSHPPGGQYQMHKRSKECCCDWASTGCWADVQLDTSLE